jgi:type I restriction enzyme S subunit
LQQCGAIFDIQDGNHGSDYPRQAEFGDEGVPFVTAKQLENGAVHIADAPRLPKERASRLRTGFAKADDVLLTHNASVGEVAVAPADAGDFLLGTSVTYWRCNPEALAPRYLFYFMRSRHFQDQLRFIMKQTTRNQVSVLKQVNLWICLPPLREQRRIVAELDVLQAAVDTARRLQNGAGAELNALLPSVLDRSFRGEQ